MYNFKNKNLFSNNIFNPDKSQRYYYDFGTGNKIERKEVKEERDAFLEAVNKTSNKSQNQKKDAFLEGFNDPYGEKREQERKQKEQERKEKFANIRANADNRPLFSQSILSSQTNPFLEGFNQDKNEENKWTGNLLKKKTNNVLSPTLHNDTYNAFQELNSPPASTTAPKGKVNKKSEHNPIGTYDTNKESVMTQLSNDKEPTIRFENGDYVVAQQKAKEEQYKKKVNENAKMNDKSVWKTRKATDVIVEYAEFIKSAAKRHGVNPAILAACIYTEQANNVTITEDLEDMTQSFLGMDCSVGLGQVRVSTAKKVEDAGHMPITYDSEAINYAFRNPFTGKSVFWSDSYSRDEEIYNKLRDPETNINYAAAYLAMIQNMWNREYPEISGDTAILATLYNIGENGGERGINSSPKPREFGLFAKANYPYMKYLLGLEQELT